MTPDPDWLLFFAVPQEARPLLRRMRACGKRCETLEAPRGALGWRVGAGEIWVTGMGRRNASSVAQVALGDREPGWVLTCGFTGGLDPSLGLGDVVFDLDPWLPVEIPAKEGVRAGRFHLSTRVVATAVEKAALRAGTGADAVDMESEAIREICAAKGIASGTVRVVSDPAGTDLPLDFGALMDADDRLPPGRLALAIVRAPWRIPRLMRFGREVERAAESLADCLVPLVG